MSRPQLLIVSFSTLESDPRVLKQIDALRDRYDISTCGYGPAPKGIGTHYRIPDDRVYWRYPRPAVMARLYGRAYRANPVVSWVRDTLPDATFDVVLANDIDAVGAALELHPRFGVHADLHEFAPLQNTELLRFRLFVAPFMRWQLRTFARRADSVSTVAPTIAMRLRDEFGLDPFVVMNAPPLADLPITPTGVPIRLVHAGAALRNRRLEDLITAMELLNDAGNFTLDMYLAANDPEYLRSLKARADAVPGVRVLAPVPFEDLIPTLNGYDIGLHLLAPTNFNNAYALPNKFFEYVQARLGVVIGPSPEMARILQTHGFGAIAGDFSAAALAETLRGVDQATVLQWKTAADASAPELSAQLQTRAWVSAIDAIAGE